MNSDGFVSAARAHDHATPPEAPEPTRLTVTFTVKLGLDQDLSEYFNDPDGQLSRVAAAEVFMRREVEGCLSIKGNFNGDKQDPIPMNDVEFLDFSVEIDA